MDALRHGWPLAFEGGPVLLPVETAIAQGASAPRMLISAARAATLKLANQRHAAVPHAPVLIAGGEDFTMRDALPIADPALDLGNPLKGPFKAVTLDWEESARAALELAVDTGIAATCAEAVGVMDKTVALTVDYMNTRKQFGVAIASFQALRHRVADMKMQLELARSMSYYASLKLNAPAAERRAAMARAKVQLGTAMRFVGQQAVQLHGGIGVTDEYIVSHCFKKLTQLEITWGDTLHQLGEVSARMQDTAGVFA